jgi:hypothetical protein
MCAILGCGDSPGKVADAHEPARVAPPAPAKPKVWEPRPVVAPPRTFDNDSLAADATDSLADSASARRDSVPPRVRTRGPRPFILSPADSAKWPVPSPRSKSIPYFFSRCQRMKVESAIVSPSSIM